MWNLCEVFLLKLYELLNHYSEILLVSATITLIYLLSWFYLIFIKKDSRVKKMMDKFNGPKLIPILGNALTFAVPHNLLMKTVGDILNKYDGIARAWLANQPYIITCEAKSIEKILSSSVHINKSKEYVFFENWLGTGLLTSNGKKWHRRRKLLTPTFHFKILEDFIEIFNEQAATMVQILEGHADNKSFDILPYVARCTLDIICETAMGVKLYAQRESDSEYVRAVYGIEHLLVERITKPWLRPEFIWKLIYGQKEQKHLNILHNFTENVIHERRIELNISKSQECNEIKVKRRLAFLDLLLEMNEDGKGLSDLDIREETDTFMFEGHDTTTASLSWTIFLLACNQDCQKLVRQELNEIFGDDIKRQITSADLLQMKYLEYCIKESLRLYPSVPGFLRHLTSDLDLGDGMAIPSSTTILIYSYALHRDPIVFPNPEKFCPERFEPKNCIGRNPFAYIPFSGGPRNCIGQKFALMEEKVILSKLFLNFKVEAAEKLEDIQLIPDLILRPKNGLHVKFTKI